MSGLGHHYINIFCILLFFYFYFLTGSIFSSLHRCCITSVENTFQSGKRWTPYEKNYVRQGLRHTSLDSMLIYVSSYLTTQSRYLTSFQAVLPYLCEVNRKCMGAASSYFTLPPNAALKMCCPRSVLSDHRKLHKKRNVIGKSLGD